MSAVVEAYRAQYRIQRAELLPKVSANGQGQRQYLPRRMTGADQGMIRSTSAAIGLPSAIVPSVA